MPQELHYLPCRPHDNRGEVGTKEQEEVQGDTIDEEVGNS